MQALEGFVKQLDLGRLPFAQHVTRIGGLALDLFRPQHTAVKVALGVTGALAGAVVGYHAFFNAFYTNPWYSFKSFGVPGTGYDDRTDSNYFDIAGQPWTLDLEDNWQEILAELETFLKTDAETFIPYFRPDLVNRTGAWKTLGVMAWGLENRAIIRKFPKTMKAFERAGKRIVGISFNHLEPNGVVKPHRGNTNGIARVHLGLRVPGGAPECCFIVNNEERPWEEGKMLAFCDAHYHTAKNLTDKSRYILLFDYVRDEYASVRNYMCAKVCADLIVQFVHGKSSLVRLSSKIAPGLTRFVLYHSFCPIFHLIVVFYPDVLAYFS